MSAEKAKRARKPNFAPSESTLILQLAEENLEIIRDKFSNVLTNQKKAAVWKAITDKVKDSEDHNRGERKMENDGFGS